MNKQLHAVKIAFKIYNDEFKATLLSLVFFNIFKIERI